MGNTAFQGDETDMPFQGDLFHLLRYPELADRDKWNSSLRILEIRFHCLGFHNLTNGHVYSLFFRIVSLCEND